MNHLEKIDRLISLATTNFIEYTFGDVSLEERMEVINVLEKRGYRIDSNNAFPVQIVKEALATERGWLDDLNKDIEIKAEQERKESFLSTLTDEEERQKVTDLFDHRLEFYKKVKADGIAAINGRIGQIELALQKAVSSNGIAFVFTDTIQVVFE